MKSRPFQQQGFTLIELVLYVAVIPIIVLPLSAFLLTNINSRIKHQTISEVEGEGMQVVQMIGQAVRNASAINAPPPQAFTTSLSLATANPATNPTVFSLSSGGIFVSEGGGATVRLTSTHVTVSGLSFGNFSRSGTPGTVHFSFTVTYLNPEGRNEYSYAKTFYDSGTIRK